MEPGPLVRSLLPVGDYPISSIIFLSDFYISFRFYISIRFLYLIRILYFYPIFRFLSNFYISIRFLYFSLIFIFLYNFYISIQFLYFYTTFRFLYNFYISIQFLDLPAQHLKFVKTYCNVIALVSIMRNEDPLVDLPCPYWRNTFNYKAQVLSR